MLRFDISDKITWALSFFSLPLFPLLIETMVIYFPLNFVLWNCNLLFLETLTFRLWLKVKFLMKGYACFFSSKRQHTFRLLWSQFLRRNFSFPTQHQGLKVANSLAVPEVEDQTCSHLPEQWAPRASALGWNSLIRYPILDEPWAVSTATHSDTNYSVIKIYRTFKINKTVWKVKESRHKKVYTVCHSNAILELTKPISDVRKKTEWLFRAESDCEVLWGKQLG